ncbi:MAG: hypothetical protein AB1649_07265 [Chloroflexota bacterium]
MSGNLPDLKSSVGIARRGINPTATCAKTAKAAYPASTGVRFSGLRTISTVVYHRADIARKAN